MRTLAIVALLAGTATAGPVVRVGAVGGYDTAAPGHREDGIALGLGYRYDGFTAELDYAYLDYDGSTGIAGGTQRMGVLGQAKLLEMKCTAGEVCPHLDLDVGAGQRWVRWTPSGPGMLGAAAQPTTERRGRELMIGASANFGWHLSLHYVLFQPDEGPQFVCRGTCPMRTTGNDVGVLLEASFAFGG